MAKRLLTKPPVIPKGWTGKNYNSWHQYLDAEISLIYMNRKQLKAVEELIHESR